MPRKSSSQSIRELDLSAGDFQIQEILACDWSNFTKLESLFLDSVWIDVTTTSSSLPSLKFLHLEFMYQNYFRGDVEDGYTGADDDDEGQLEFDRIKIERLHFLPTLGLFPNVEKLRLTGINFSLKLFTDFIHVLKNDLLKLRILYFSRADFNSLEVFNEKRVFELTRNFDFVDSVEELVLEYYYFDTGISGGGIEIYKLFRTIFASLRLISMRQNETNAEETYKLMPFLKEKNIDLKLYLDFCEDRLNTVHLVALQTPIELSEILSYLYMQCMSAPAYLRKFFTSGSSFEKLTKIEFHKCGSLNNGILKMIAQLCLYLAFLKIGGCNQISGAGIKYFVFFWEKRKSTKLSIDCSISTEYGRDRGIFNDGKYWKIIRKNISDVKAQFTRLIIWDDKQVKASNSVPKMLMIKNYGEDKLLNAKT